MFGKVRFIKALWDRDVKAEVMISRVCVAGFVVVKEGFEVHGAGSEDFGGFVDVACALGPRDGAYG